jgi:hypothetical protein
MTKNMSYGLMHLEDLFVSEKYVLIGILFRLILHF